jgi:hypothetical protein
VAGAIRLEKLGKPVVYIVADNFAHDAELASQDNGMPTLRTVTVPGEEFFQKRISKDQIAPLAANAASILADGLTRPLSQNEMNPKQKKTDVDKPITITAENYEAALEKFNELFLANHWGSGLPLVPPTAERVKWMLSGTSRSPDEVVGIVAPKNGKATVRKIAINAVMAGAKPEYLPVIIAAIEGFIAKSFDLVHVLTSSGSFFPAVIVHGPIAKEIGMNSGTGLLGHGFRANNTIGHAIRLSLLNIGHVWPGENDMALIGRPASHTFFTFAENEQLSPWEPYHVSIGLKKEESAVTVSTVGGYTATTGMVVYGGGAVATWSVDTILEAIIKDISRDRRIFASFKRGQAIPPAHPAKHILVLAPEFARELNRRGYSRASLQKYIYEKTSVPFEELSPQEVKGVKDRIEGTKARDILHYDLIPADRIPVFEEALKPGGKVPVVIAPRDITILVSGGIPAYTWGMSYFRVSQESMPVKGAKLTKGGR